MDLNGVLTKNLQLMVNSLKNYDQVVKMLQDKQVLLADMIVSIEECPTFEAKKDKLFKILLQRGPNVLNDLKEIFNETDNQHLTLALGRNRLMNQEEVDGIPRQPLYEVYRLNSTPRGVVGIFNNFKDETSREDVERLKIFWESLDFTVKIEVNLTAQTFKKKLSDFIHNANDSESISDCCILFIMSPAKVDKNNYSSIDIELEEDTIVKSKYIISQFSTTDSPHLAKKPKLIFMSTCTSNKNDIAIDLNKENELRNIRLAKKDGVPTQILYPSSSDIVMVYPLTTELELDENVKFTSSFINELISVFKLRAHSCDLLTMLEEVDRNLLQNSKQINLQFQTLYIEKIGFSKKFFLK